MKKLMLGMLSMLFVLSSASAQKRCNLEFTYGYPTNNFVIPQGDTIPVVVSIRNLGPDALDLNDTIRYGWSIDNIGRVTNGVIPVGGTLQDTFLRAWADDTPENDTFSFCNYLIKDAQTGFIDTLQINDTTCITIILQGTGPVGISQQFHETQVLRTFPNPATNSITCLLPDHAKEAYQLHICDLAGRLIQTKMYAAGSIKGGQLHCDISALPQGFYMLDISNSGMRYFGKIWKQ